MATNNTNCDCNKDCTSEIPEGSILPNIPDTNPLTPDGPSLIFLPNVVRQTVSERQHTTLETKEKASSQSKDIACDTQVEEPSTTVTTTSGGGQSSVQKVLQSISFSITIPVIHNT